MSDRAPMRHMSGWHGKLELVALPDGRVQTVNPDGNSGPSWTNHGGDTDWLPTCAGCKHLAYHDFHYPYCSGIEADNQRDTAKYAYPWRGAGKHIYRAEPANECPYPMAEKPKDSPPL